jgi:hypothetical protein
MTTQAEFPSKLAKISDAMEREEWSKAIHELENIGPIPDKFHAVASNVLFYLYISRNQYEQLTRLSERFEPAKSKDCVSVLLLFRDKELEYPVELPKDWTLVAWEKAIESHALSGKMEAKELQLCLFFLSLLNRPQLLGMLLSLSVESGEILDNESITVVLRCYLKRKWFTQARRFLWVNNLNNIAFERFNFLLDRVENNATPIPESNDKFLTFLRYKFGSHFPAKNSCPNSTI